MAGFASPCSQVENARHQCATVGPLSGEEDEGSREGSLDLGTIDIWGLTGFCAVGEELPWALKEVCSIHSLYLPGVVSISHLSCANHRCLKTCQMPRGVGNAKSAPLRKLK